jgi:hypothetical protein
LVTVSGGGAERSSQRFGLVGHHFRETASVVVDGRRPAGRVLQTGFNPVFSHAVRTSKPSPLAGKHKKVVGAPASSSR